MPVIARWANSDNSLFLEYILHIQQTYITPEKMGWPAGMCCCGIRRSGAEAPCGSFIDAQILKLDGLNMSDKQCKI